MAGAARGGGRCCPAVSVLLGALLCGGKREALAGGAAERGEPAERADAPRGREAESPVDLRWAGLQLLRQRPQLLSKQVACFPLWWPVN